MVGPLGKVVSPFQPTSRKRSGDRTTTLRRRNVDAAGTVAYPLLILETKSFSLLLLLLGSFSFLGGIGPSPSRPLWIVPTSLPRLQPSLVLLPMQDKMEDFFCNACGHPLQNLTHLLLDCPASEPLRHTIFGTTSSSFDL